MPQTIATVLTSPFVRVTLLELDTAYGQEDLWWLLEAHSVCAYNQRVMSERDRT